MASKKKDETSQGEESGLNLSSLSPTPGSRKRRRRLGIGEGSGHGKTSGKGHKGHRARAGYRLNPGFEGGQMPLYRRLPKIGFTSQKRVRGDNVFAEVSLSRLAKLGLTGEINVEKMRELGLVRGKHSRVKILGGTEVPSKLVVEAHAFSRSAAEALKNAGGDARVIS